MSRIQVFFFIGALGIFTLNTEKSRGTQQENPVPAARGEKEIFVSPRIEVTLHQPRVSPALPLIVGDRLFYSESIARSNDGCRGRNLWVVSLHQQDETAVAVTGVPHCIVRLLSNGTQAFVHARVISGDRRTDHLYSLTIEANGRVTAATVLTTVLGDENTSLGRARLVYAADSQNRNLQSIRNQWFGISRGQLFSLSSLHTVPSSFPVLDLFSLSSSEPSWQAPASLPEIAVSDFTLLGNQLYFAAEGDRNTLGRLGSARLHPTAQSLTGFRVVGNPTEASAPEWTELPDETIGQRRAMGIRMPQFLTATLDGVVGLDATPLPFEARSVFYYSPETRLFTKIPHLSNHSNVVTGLQFTQNGLLVADGDDRKIQWFGSRSPFNRGFTTREIRRTP